jgi:hypothetical protein
MTKYIRKACPELLVTQKRTSKSVLLILRLQNHVIQLEVAFGSLLIKILIPIIAIKD